MGKYVLPYNLEDVLDKVYNYVSIINKEGYVVFVNDAVKRYGKEKKDVEGKSIEQLIAEGYMKQSIFKRFMNTGKPQAMVQNDEDGIYLNWANAHYDENNNVEYVVCTEWDLKHLNELQEFLIINNTLTADENRELEYYRDKNLKLTELICNSPRMQEVVNIANRSAKADIPVLLQGESGTGKEVLMRYIHFNSQQASGPLIVVNCSAIPENLIESELFGYEKGAFTGADPKGKVGLFELANNGTLFLDEIGEMPIQTQSKLLRVLQDQKIMRVGGTSLVSVNARIIAATNADLFQAVADKSFRRDLFYRLSVLPIHIPPLRKRREDIEPLINSFVQQFNQKYKKEVSFSHEAIALMEQYDWPGNVRELENLVERLYITIIGNRITGPIMAGILNNDYNPLLQKEGAVDLKKEIDYLEYNLLISKLSEYKNLRQYAELFGVEKTTMHRKLKKHEISIQDLKQKE